MVSGEALNLETAIAQLSDLKREFDALESATVNAQQKLSVVIEQLETLSFEQSNEELSHNVDKTEAFSNLNTSLLVDQAYSDVQKPDEIAISVATPETNDDDVVEYYSGESFPATAGTTNETEEATQASDDDLPGEPVAVNNLSLSETEASALVSDNDTTLSDVDEIEGAPTETIACTSEYESTEHCSLTDELEPEADEPGAALTLSEFEVEEALCDGSNNKEPSPLSDASEEVASDLVEPSSRDEESPDELSGCEMLPKGELTEIELLIASFEEEENNADEDDFLISADCELSSSIPQDIVHDDPESDVDGVAAIDAVSDEPMTFLNDDVSYSSESEEPIAIGEYNCDVGVLTELASMADEDCQGNMHQSMEFDGIEAAKDFEFGTECSVGSVDDVVRAGTRDDEVEEIEAAASVVNNASIECNEEPENATAGSNIDAPSTKTEDTAELKQTTSKVIPFPTSQEQAVSAPPKPRRRRTLATATGIAASIAACAIALQIPEVQQLRDLPHVDQLLQRLSELQRYLA